MFNSVEAVACLLICAICFQTGFSGHPWIYNEETWPIQCKEGKHQSPIALSSKISEKRNYSSLVFEEYDVTYPAMSKNNGHSIEVRLHVENKPTVNGGGLPYTYVLDHLHFHWQSEHVVEEQRFPLELHLVHYAKQFPSVADALEEVGGVAVFAVLFYLSPDDDDIFEPLVAVIDKLKDELNTEQKMHVKVDSFFPRDKAGFYRYNGSLTTPNCTEGVIWTVFTNKLPISKGQVDAFHGIKSTEHKELQKNYRSLQELNGRKVWLRSSPIKGLGVTISPNVALKILPSLALIRQALSYL